MSELEKVLSNEDFDPSAAFTLLSSIVQESKRNWYVLFYLYLTKKLLSGLYIKYKKLKALN